MIEKCKKMFYISRPVSWLNTAYPFAAGYLISGGVVNTEFLVTTVYFLGPYNLLMYGINDVFDYDSDILNPRKGGIEGMKEQKELHPFIIKAVLITNIPFLLAIALMGTITSNCVLLLVLFLVVAYSLKYLRFKEKPFLDSVTSSMHFVGPLVFALSLNGFPAGALPYVIAFLLWGIASHAFGAVQDIIPDRRGGISSIATFFGASWTVWFSFILYSTAAIIITLCPWPYTIIGVAGFIYAANTWSCLHIADKDSARANVPWRRFIWINFLVGFVVTMVLIITHIQ